MDINVRIQDERDSFQKTGRKQVLIEIDHFRTFSTEKKAEKYAAKATKVLEKAMKKL